MKGDQSVDMDSASRDRLPLLALYSIHAAYGKKEVLRGVSLVIEEGAVVALVGPNGAGKSTVLKVVAGLLRASDGTVAFAGETIDMLPAHARPALGIGYLPQGAQIFPSLTVAENLSLSLYGKGLPAGDGVIVTTLDALPELRHQLNVRAGLLSGGQRQQLAVAMTLAQSPRLLLLDEPTAGVSPMLADALLKAVQRENSVNNTTVLLVEQNVHLAAAVSDEIIVLVDGQVVTRLRPADDIDLLAELERYYLEPATRP